MGRTVLGRGASPLLRVRGVDGSAHDDGAGSGAVCGSYVHGIFDHPALRGAFLNGLRATRGLPLRESAAPSPDDDIERLADHVEAYLDADLLERIVGLEAR
jgi:adenosylcobyric acid synthase